MTCTTRTRAAARISGVAAAALAMTFGAAAASCDPGETELRFHHTAAPSGNARGEAALALQWRIDRELDGRACMTVTARAEDHTDATLPEALAEGRFEIGAVAAGSLGDVSPRYLVFDLPFLFDDVEAVLAFQASDTGRDLLADAQRAGMKGLAFLLDGFDQIAATRAVVAPDDLSGMSFRVGGSELDRATFSLIGADPVETSGQAVAEALADQRIGALDGTWSDLFSEGAAAKSGELTETNHTVRQYILVASAGFWDGLDPELRADLERIVIETAHERNRLAFELNEAAKFAMKHRGIEVRELDPDQRLAWKRAMQEVWFGFGGEIGFDQISTALHVNRLY